MAEIIVMNNPNNIH